MTIEEARRLRVSGRGVSSPAALIPFMPSQVIPAGASDVNTIEQARPVTLEQYNNVPLNDVKLFRQYKHTDSLHRADSLASHFRRAEALNSYLKENGASKFAHAYD